MTQSERVSDEELQYQIKLSLSPTKQKMAQELQHLRKLVQSDACRIRELSRQLAEVTRERDEAVLAERERCIGEINRPVILFDTIDHLDTTVDGWKRAVVQRINAGQKGE